MTDVLVGTYFASAMLCLLLGGHWLTSGALSPRIARTLGANYLLYTCQHGLAVLALGYAWGPALMLRPIVAMLLGPGLYLYYRSVISDRPLPVLAWVGHSLPAIFVAGLLLTAHPWRAAIDIAIIASFIGYLAPIGYSLTKGTSSLAHLGPHAGAAYRWLGVLAGLLLIGVLLELLIYWDIQRGTLPSRSFAILSGAGVFLVFTLVTAFLALRRSPLLEWMNSLGEAQLHKWRRLPLADKQAEAIFRRWAALVDERRLYKKEGGITLKTGARMLGVPMRHLSEAINRVYGSSFSQYLNDCRLAEVKRLLIDCPDTPITELMLETGFETKSNFNKEFRRLTQMTPSEYRQSQKSGNS